MASKASHIIAKDMLNAKDMLWIDYEGLSYSSLVLRVLVATPNSLNYSMRLLQHSGSKPGQRP